MYRNHIKRGLDIILALTGLMLASWLYVIIAVAVFINDPGPVFFGQKRIGKNKTQFTLWKFRSMKMSTPADVPTHQLKNPEQYITKVGQFLRKSSLDEIPQLWNILKGDMSVIGPRPALWNQYDLIAERDQYGANDVRPGLSGWAHIHGRDELEIPVKARLDGEYVKRLSFLFDCRCFFGTAFHTLRGDGVVEGGTGTLHENGENPGDLRQPAGTAPAGRVLMLTTVASTQEQFCMPFTYLLQEMGYDVDVACNFLTGNNISDEKIESFRRDLIQKNITPVQLGFSRNPLKPANIKAYKELLKLLKTRKYAFIHCHTPIAGAFGRLAASQTGTKIIYMAHGFHFYKGAPLQNKLIYYPIEKLLARRTDVLITINEEDRALARRKLPAGKITYLPGVGIDLTAFDTGKLTAADKSEKRQDIGIPAEGVMLFSVGELNQNKNHRLVIESLKMLPDNVHYVIAGIDKMNGQAAALADGFGVSDRVHFLGYRTDIRELCAVADIFVLPSFREGLSVSLMEAMAAGLPCAVSRIRGNVDLIDETNKGGAFFAPDSVQECAQAILRILQADRQRMGTYNREKITQFSREKVLHKLRKIYVYMGNIALSVKVQ